MKELITLDLNFGEQGNLFRSQEQFREYYDQFIKLCNDLMVGRRKIKDLTLNEKFLLILFPIGNFKELQFYFIVIHMPRSSYQIDEEDFFYEAIKKYIENAPQEEIDDLIAYFMEIVECPEKQE